jgi:THO complex subunit 2
MDADFSAQFIKQMHLLGTPNFSTAHCYDRLIGDHIGNIVFSLTQAEARNYGK